MKIKFEQRQVKSKCSITISPVKPCYCNIFLCICNNFSVQNCLDKPVFNNVSRHNHSSPINNIVTNKIKLFPQLFPLSPQTVLKQRWQYVSVLWSIITTTLDIYSYKYKDDYICKGLLRGHNKYLVEFLLRNKPPTSIKIWCHLLVPVPIIY